MTDFDGQKLRLFGFYIDDAESLKKAKDAMEKIPRDQFLKGVQDFEKDFTSIADSALNKVRNGGKITPQQLELLKTSEELLVIAKSETSQALNNRMERLEAGKDPFSGTATRKTTLINEAGGWIIPEKTKWDRIHSLDASIRGGDISINELRQVGDHSFVSGVDHNGKEFLLKGPAVPDNVGKRAKDVEGYILANSNDFVPAEGARNVKYFASNVTEADFDRAAHDVRGAKVKDPKPMAAPEAHSTTLHISKETGAVHSSGLAHKLGNKLGMVAGVAVGGYFTLRGEFAQAAEVVIPGAPSVVALAHGRPTEATMAGIEEFPLGFVATEVARPVAQALGYDVDPNITQSIKAALTPEARQPTEFDRVYDTLPAKVTPDMPPEVQSLIEQKNMIVQAETRLADVNLRTGTMDYDLAGNRLKAEKQVDMAQNGYTEQYDALEKSGSLAAVKSFLEGNKAYTPDKAPGVSEPEKIPQMVVSNARPQQNGMQF